jgi:hypothetical protein
VGWYTVFKKIKGKLYAYRQKTWREGEAVRTISEYIGNADHLGGAVSRTGRGLTLHAHAAHGLRPLPESDAVRAWASGGLVELQAADMLEQSRRALRHYSSNRGSSQNLPEILR